MDEAIGAKLEAIREALQRKHVGVLRDVAKGDLRMLQKEGAPPEPTGKELEPGVALIVGLAALDESERESLRLGVELDESARDLVRDVLELIDSGSRDPSTSGP
jgi:hypothetical protein